VSAEGPIESIFGRLDPNQERLLWFVITYADGEVEHREGSLVDASSLASEHGLQIVPTFGRWFRWVRDPDTWPIPPVAGP